MGEGLIVMQANDAIAISSAVLAVGLLQTDLELLSLHPHLGAKGLLGPRASKGRWSPLRLLTDLPPEHHLAIKKVTVGAVIVRVLGAGLIIHATLVRTDATRMLTAYLLCIAATLALQFRGGLGNNGADQMFTVLMIANFVGLASAGLPTQRIALTFVACQLSLAYLTSALVKIKSRRWRSGEHLRNLLESQTFGSLVLSKAFAGFPSGLRAVNICFLLWEATMWLAPFAPPAICSVLLAIGAMFHVGVAIVMGLNTFVFAFLGAYPAAFWLSHFIWKV